MFIQAVWLPEDKSRIDQSELSFFFFYFKQT